MSQVKASSEAVRQVKSGINATVSELRGAAAKVRAVGSGGWNDAQGQQFHALMQKIAKLVESPIETLQASQPKLEKLAQSLDAYGSVKF
jgi:uncharacterized protein YukE